jgi:hypothetical protein
MLDSACNTVGNFITYIFTLPHIRCQMTATPFLTCHDLGSYIRNLRQLYRYNDSNHRHFIDYRHISCTIHLWTAFHSRLSPLLRTTLCRLQRASYKCAIQRIARRSIIAAFQGVTPSFHLSEYQFSKVTLLQDSFPHYLTCAYFWLHMVYAPIRFPNGM